MALQAELIYFAATKIRIGRGIVATKTAAGGLFYLSVRWRCRRNCSSLLRRLLQAELIYFAATKIRIGRGNVAATTSQAGHSFLRHDGAAAIPDFRPRIENRCSHKVKTRAIRASILDFRPRLANRCSHKVKAGAIRALILDFKPRLANRRSQKVKTRAIHAAHLQHAFHHALTMRLAIDSLHRHRFDSGGKSGC